MIRQIFGSVADTLLRLQIRRLPISAWLPRFYQVKHLIREDMKDTLDASCGAGELTLWMARRGMRVSGVDLSQAEIELARARAAEQGLDIEFRVGDLSARTPFPGGRFDQIISLDTVTHIPDDTAVFREFYRLLVSGGRLVVSLAAFAPSGSGDLYPAQKALRRWVPRCLDSAPVWNGKAWLHASPEDLRIGFRQCHFYNHRTFLRHLPEGFELEHYEYGLHFFSALATDLVFGIRYARFFQPVVFMLSTRLDRLLCRPRRPGYLLFVVLRRT